MTEFTVATIEAMNGLALKLIACTAMVVDHVGYLFFPEETIFRIIGRISFPLFAFLIAEGFLKSNNRKSYLKRLSLFALISQVPFFFFERLAGNTEFLLNIFFTLALGLLLLMVISHTRDILMKISCVIIVLAIAHYGHFSYGAYGIATILGSYLYLRRPLAGGITLSLLPFVETLRLLSLKIYFLQFFAIVSLVPIYFYNGTAGPKISRWWFYWFYPVHLAILCGLSFVV